MGGIDAGRYEGFENPGQILPSFKDRPKRSNWLTKLKSIQNSLKIDVFWQKIDLKRCLHRRSVKNAPGDAPRGRFLAISPFFVDFGVPAGPGWVPEWALGRARNASKSSKISVVSQKSCRPAPGRLREGPRAPPGTSQDQFFDDFWLIFEIVFSLKSHSDIYFSTQLVDGLAKQISRQLHSFVRL